MTYQGDMNLQRGGITTVVSLSGNYQRRVAGGTQLSSRVGSGVMLAQITPYYDLPVIRNIWQYLVGRGNIIGSGAMVYASQFFWK
jgi:hypothetical protein